MVEEEGRQGARVSSLWCCAYRGPHAGRPFSTHSRASVSFTSSWGFAFCHMKNLSLLSFACSLNQVTLNKRGPPPVTVPTASLGLRMLLLWPASSHSNTTGNRRYLCLTPNQFPYRARCSTPPPCALLFSGNSCLKARVLCLDSLMWTFCFLIF